MKMTKRVRAFLDSCPKTGHGVHNFLFKAAIRLHHEVADDLELEGILRAAVKNCDRDVPDREIEDAIRNGRRVVEGASNGTKKKPAWPNVNTKLVQEIVSKGPTMAQLEGCSPVPCGGSVETEGIIDCLFPGNPLICAGLTRFKQLTRSREEWRGFLDRQQFIVPQAMLSQFGTTSEGKRSMRTLTNVGPRMFAVVEFDTGSFDDHAARLFHLGRYAPLALVVHSSGKSLHGWFPCSGQPEQQAEGFFRYAVSLGADRATWTAHQLVRMPGGLRDNGKRQRILFYNPQTLESK